MSDGLVKVRLWGTLGDQFGHEHEFMIRTPVEALAALDANYPGFRRELIKNERYYIVADEGLRDEHTLLCAVAKEVDIVPYVEGEDFGISALIAAAVAAMGITSTVGVTVATVTIGLLLSALLIGVSMLLTPKPKKATNGSDERKESNQFSGPDNLVGQGASVPIIYGRCFVGSVVISIGIETSDQAI
jgi:predicted phage tail protein